MMEIISIAARPFALLLRHLSEVLDSYGLALIVLALLITAIRIPFDFKSKRGTMKTSLLMPRTKAIQEKYAGNPMKINQEIQKLYREEGAKPLSGCVWMIFPMLILLILFQIIRQPLTHLMGLDQTQVDALRTALEALGITVGTGALYQVEMSGYIRPYFDHLHAIMPELFNINMNFLGLDIGQTPNWRALFERDSTPQDIGLFMLPVVSGLAAFLSSKMMMATNYIPQAPQQAQMMKTMMLMMPVMSIGIGFTFPGAMSLYWTISSLTFAIASVFINRHYKKIFLGMQADMEERERQKQAVIDAEREEKRKKTEALRAQGATLENKGTSKKKKHLHDREKERQRQAAQRAAERETEEGEEEEDPSRVGHRKFARGRAYSPDRYEGEDDLSTDPAPEEAEDEETEVLSLTQEDDLPEGDDYGDDLDEADDFDDNEDADYEAEDDYGEEDEDSDGK